MGFPLPSSSFKSYCLRIAQRCSRRLATLSYLVEDYTPKRQEEADEEETGGPLLPRSVTR